MPARIVVVHDARSFLDPLAAALRLQGHDVAAFTDSLLAWDALAAAKRVELLVTRVRLGDGKPHGIALAKWARSNRPEVRVLFTARPEMQQHTEGLGMFLATPVEVPKVVDVIVRLMATDRSEWDYRPPLGR
jgi:DNA-binding NtrC family response regulator